MRRRNGALCAVVVVLLALPVAAFDQPTVNLGLTSFMDGGPPAGPGFYFTEYIQYYTAGSLPGGPPTAEVDVWASINQFIYQSNKPLFMGGKWGMNVIVPLVSIDSSGAINDNGGGLGDILVGPFLQWDPIMGDQGPVFMHRIELQTLWPTGKYDNNKAINPGSNFFSFNPYWAGTYWVTPKLTASWRLHYLWNDKNDDPFVGFGPLSDTQAGEAVHTNFAASYEVKPKQLRVGVNGYYFKQTGKSEWAGAAIAPEEEVLGVGPGALISFNQDTHLFLNAYFESSVSNRPDGERYIARVVKHFK
jgi:hypothetical protein